MAVRDVSRTVSALYRGIPEFPAQPKWKEKVTRKNSRWKNPCSGRKLFFPPKEREKSSGPWFPQKKNVSGRPPRPPGTEGTPTWPPTNNGGNSGKRREFWEFL